MPPPADNRPPATERTLPPTHTPPDTINANVAGRELSGPGMGFGQLWRKTYRIPLTGSRVRPRELVRIWKARFPAYWPEGSRFAAEEPEITPGEVAVINLEGPAGAPIATGVVVTDADEDSFTFETPQGHIFAGTITFSATADDGLTVAQIVSLVRASDPLFEAGARAGVVHQQEDRFWWRTLTNLAADFGVHGQPVYIERELIDPAIRWSAAGNLWHNSAIRTLLYLPVHGVKRLLGKAG